MNPQEQKLREEFIEKFYGGDLVAWEKDGTLLYPEDIADWWISRLSQAIQTERESLRNRVEEAIRDTKDYKDLTVRLVSIVSSVLSSKEQSHE